MEIVPSSRGTTTINILLSRKLSYLEHVDNVLPNVEDQNKLPVYSGRMSGNIVMSDVLFYTFKISNPAA